MDDDALLDDKTRVLRRQGTLNPRPNSVRDPLFAPEGGFFDRRDIVQVKYEMLRKARVDGETITYAAAELGLSRVAFYKALIAFEDSGLAGLLPHKRGPRQGHKLTDEVIDFLRAALAADASLGAAALSKLVRKRFRRSVHPRSIERAMMKKKRR